MWALLHSGCYFKWFAYVNPFNPYNNFVKDKLIGCAHFRDGETDTEMLSVVCKVLTAIG